MNYNKMNKAALLLEELGEIGDVYLQEAMTYRKRRVNARPWIAAAACILVVLDNIFGGFNKAENQQQSAPATLDSFLTENRGTIHCTAVSEDEIDYFGSTYLVLQYEGDETIWRSRDLTQREVDRIFDLLGKGDEVGSDSSSLELNCRVWLVCEDGTVLSPYLKNTDGNKGYAVLFDYEAEILPSSSLISCISEILN